VGDPEPRGHDDHRRRGRDHRRDARTWLRLGGEIRRIYEGDDRAADREYTERIAEHSFRTSVAHAAVALYDQLTVAPIKAPDQRPTMTASDDVVDEYYTEGGPSA